MTAKDCAPEIVVHMNILRSINSLAGLSQLMRRNKSIMGFVTVYSGNMLGNSGNIPCLWSHAFLRIDTPLYASVLSCLLSGKGGGLVINTTWFIKVLSKAEIAISNYNTNNYNS